MLAGTTYRFTPLDSTHGVAFDRGLVVMSFAIDANGSPILTAVSAADANVVAWTAPLA